MKGDDDEAGLRLKGCPAAPEKVISTEASSVLELSLSFQH